MRVGAWSGLNEVTVELAVDSMRRCGLPEVHLKGVTAGWPMTAHHPPRLLGLSARKRTTCQNMDGGGRPKAIVNGVWWESRITLRCLFIKSKSPGRSGKDGDEECCGTFCEQGLGTELGTCRYAASSSGREGLPPEK